MRMISPTCRKLPCTLLFLLLFFSSFFFLGKKGIIWIASQSIECFFGVQFSCNDFTWTEEGLILSNVLVGYEPKAKLEIPKLELSFSWNSWLRLRTVDGLCTLDMEATWKEDVLQIALDFSHLDLLQLQSFVPVQLEEGKLEGKVFLERNEKESFRVTSRLRLLEPSIQVSSGSLSCKCLNIEGEGILTFAQTIHFKPSWGRAEYREGSWRSESSQTKQMEGSIFYAADLGMQWENCGFFCVDGESVFASLSGKGFWADGAKSWLDLTLDSLGGKCSIESDFLNWRVQLENVIPFWGRFLRGFKEDLVPLYLTDWEWKQGEISSTFQVASQADLLQWENFEAREVLVSHKKQEDKSIFCEHVQIHFGSEQEKGAFSVNGISMEWPFDLGYRMKASNWSSSGEIAAGKVFSWGGNIEIGSKEGGEKFLLPATLAMSSHASGHLKVQGVFADYPFEVRALQEDSLWSLFFEGGAFSLNSELSLEKTMGRLLIGLDDWAFEEFFADFLVNRKKIRLTTSRLESDVRGCFWDLRLQKDSWDIARLVGSLQEGNLVFDPFKTEILGSSVEFKSVDSEPRIAFSLNIPWESSFLLEEFGLSLPSHLKTSLSGSIGVNFQYEKDLFCKWIFSTEHLLWEGQNLSYQLTIEKAIEEWLVSLQTTPSPQMYGPDLQAAFALSYERGTWTIRNGNFQGIDPLFGCFSCHFYGQYQRTGQGQILWEDAIYFSEGPFLQGCMIQGTGKGCASFHLPSLDCEVDMDLLQISLNNKRFNLEQKKTIHAFFSPSKGWMFQGVDLHWQVDGQSQGESQIHLLHYHPTLDSWLFQETHIHCSEDLFSILAQEKWISFHPHHDIDLVADIRIDQEFSKLSCFVKEGLLPLDGELRHIQNLELSCDKQQIFCDFLYVHQNQDVQVRLEFFRKDFLAGRLILESPVFPLLEGEKPLEILWEYHPDWGILIDSIQGSFSGLSAAFYLQASDCQSHLIGNCYLDCKRFLPFVPPALAEFFIELNMGKGYELKGKLHIDRRRLSEIFFTGLLTGKEIELCGCQLRSLSSQIDVKPEEIKIFDLKISDLSGFYKMDTIVMQGKGEDPWTFHIPLLVFSEFRPSMLRKVGESEGSISPLVIRDMRFRDVRGILDDKQTYTAEGELHFINSYKREKTVFDVPSNLLGRIIGLDMDLLIPVRGFLRYSLKDGRFHITALEEAYSEANRSQFFLSGKVAPTVDLDGNLQIAIKMKQFVLFKLTEAFTILIDGKLNDPSYHLQKKK